MKQLPEPMLFPLATAASRGDELAPYRPPATRAKAEPSFVDVEFREAPKERKMSAEEIAAGKNYCKAKAILKSIRFFDAFYHLETEGDAAKAMAECMTAVKQMQIAIPILKKLIGFSLPKKGEL